MRRSLSLPSFSSFSLPPWNLLLVLCFACTQPDGAGHDDPSDRGGATGLGVTQRALTTGDGDGDGVGDSTDNCPQLANADQANSNGVGPGDACELSLVLSNGLLNQYARFQSHKELIANFAPLSFSVGTDLLQVEAPAPSLAFPYFSLLSEKLGVQSLGEVLPGFIDSVGGNEVLRIELGSSSVLGGAKASEVLLRLDGTASISVAFFEGSTARGTQAQTNTGTSLKRFAPTGGARFDRIELRATSGRVSLRGPNEVALFTIGQAQLPCPSGYQRLGQDCVDIDECAGLTHLCDALTTCTNTQGSYACGVCPAGYRGTGNSSCVDIDECAEHSAGCDALATCSNTAGGYQCGPCPAGYRGNGHACSDIDECAESLDSCDPLVTCSNHAGGYDCGACPAGYAGGGSSSCVDVDECTGPDRVCDLLVTCTNTPGSYACGACPTGYRGDGTSCTDVDECLEGSATCSPLVQCGNTAGGYQCGACPNGFEGDGHSCADVDECARGTAQCAAGVACTNNQGGYACGACPSGYGGDGQVCIDIDECSDNPCDARVSCTNTPGSFTCGACPAGFRGDGHTSCVDIDECAEDLDTCSALVTCGNTLGSYACSPCPAGYAGDGHTCTDVDECAAGTDQCDALVTCTNTDGGYGCGPCPSGYRSEARVCLDLDECADAPCASLTSCTNTPGSYLCSACPAGYQGDGYAGCLDIDECAVQNGGCTEAERCENTPGSHRCRGCAPGSVGVATQCGVGACASSGVTACVQGEIRDSCVPGTAAASDATCNAADDDCDSSTDEDYPGSTSVCGTGVCAATGLIRCVSGQVVNTCMPGAARGPDVTCDGVDDDCDGSRDEEFAAQTLACGVGACLRVVSRSCVAGSVGGPACVPGIPATADFSCDGVDDDCDGSADEDYPAQSSVCGQGACLAGGVTRCIDAHVVNSCVPGAGAAADASCNGVDDDCDGAIDEDFVQSTTSCGTGACAGSGTLRCVQGSVQNTCVVPVGSSCDDGNECSGGGTCDATGACVPTTPGSVCCFGATVSDPLAQTALDPHVVTSFAEAVAPLHTGSFASQWPLTPGTIDAGKVAVIQGRVLDAQGNPFPCATISVPKSAQYGSTRTRADGSFMLAVNGGAQHNVRVEVPGFMTSYRAISTEYHRFAHLAEIRLLPHAPAQPVSSSASTITVVAGELETDADGSRRATLLFAPGTQASVQGESSPRSEYAVRVKEMTNRSVTGRDGMPATLPPQTAFTYAFSMSLEGAENAHVTFNKPIAVYVENFLAFPVGEPAPVGRYDETLGQWVAEESGRVIGIVGVDAQGRAQLNIDAVPGADDPSVLGINDAELVQLALRYAVGQSLWRVSTQHFSYWDINWGWGPPDDAELPRQPPPTAQQLPKGEKPNCVRGSIIECETQVLREEVDVAGTPFSLVYSSGRQKGSATRQLHIPLTGSTYPASVREILLNVEVAGVTYPKTFPASPNLSYTFAWPGLDASGRYVSGRQIARVRLGYSYGGSYLSTEKFGYNGGGGGSGGGGVITGDRSRFIVSLWQVTDVALGNVDAGHAELGGWTLSAHHLLDLAEPRIMLGDGTEQGPIEDAAEVSVLADNNSDAPFVNATGHAVEGPDGSIFSVVSNRVYKIAPNGTISTVAGGGLNYDPAANDVPGTSVAGTFGDNLAWGPDGMLYMIRSNVVDKVDVETQRLFYVGTLPGGGGASPLSVASDGTVYTAKQGELLCLRDGRLTTVATGFSGINQVASKEDGSVVVNDAAAGVMYLVRTDGSRQRLVGGGNQPFVEGMQATSFGGFGSNGIAVDALQQIYWSSYSHNAVFRINTDGKLSRVMGTGIRGEGPSGTLATRMLLNSPQQLSIAPNGDLLVHDRQNVRILRMRLPKDPGTRIFAAQDGSELYHFDLRGRHLRTTDRYSGATLLEFGYDAEGRLIGVTDADGQTTTLERDPTGKATAIIAPHGQRTVLSINAERQLTQLDRPDGGRYTFGYTADGMLTSMHDPKSHAEGTSGYSFSYQDGLLMRDEDPLGNAQRLERTSIANGWRVQRTTPLQRTTTHEVTQEVEQALSRTVTGPDGTTGTLQRRMDLSTSFAGPGGKLYDTKRVAADRTTTYVLHNPHSVYRAEQLVPAETVTVLPSGLTRVDRVSETTSLNDDNGVVISSSTTAQVDGRSTTHTFDGASSRFETTSPAGRKLRRFIDAKGRTIRIESAGALPVVLGYDSEGRLERATQGTRETVFGYTESGASAGYLESVRDALSFETRYVRDAMGRPTQQTLPDQSTINFGWDGLGNLTSLTPPGRSEHGQGFSPISLQTAYTAPALPDGTNPVVSYTPDADRKLASIQWPDARSTAVSYTAAGQLDLVTVAEGVYDHDYYGTGTCSGCAPGKLSRITSPSGTTLSFAYDGALPTSTSWSGPVVGSVAYAYDTAFRPVTETVTAGTSSALRFGYDADSLLTCASLTSCSPVAADALQIAYDPQVTRAAQVTQGSTTETLTYNEYGELASLTGMQGATALYAEVMDNVASPRDKLGRVVTRVESLPGRSTTWQYGYDAQGRLQDVQRDGALYEHFTYDANGNRLERETDDETITADYDAQDRLTRYGHWTYGYNANGQLRTKTNTQTGAVTTYTYDVRGNLLKVELPTGEVIEYVVDGLDRRVGKKKNGVMVKRWLYRDGLRPVAELDGAGALVSRFVYASRANVPDLIVRGGVTYRVFADHLGSPRVIVSTAAGGSVVQEMEHDAFGNVLSDTSPGWQPFGFAGGLWDHETGLVRFGARDYDAITGRWTAKDPVLFRGGSTNLYQYVHGDPVNRIDPSGLWDFFFFGAYSGHMPWSPVTVAGESVGIVGYNSESGFYAAEISALGIHAGSESNYAAWFEGIESSTDGHAEQITLCEVAAGVEIPGTAGVGAGVGAFFTHNEDGGFSFIEGGVLGEHGALGLGGSLPLLNWMFE